MSKRSNKKIIWIFDFDDTLIHSKSYVRVINKHTNQIIKLLQPHEYYEYIPFENETFDLTDFNEDIVLNAEIIEPIMNKLKFAVDNFGSENVHICTARTKSIAVKKFLLDFNININVAAVGIDTYTSNTTLENAKRKKKFIDELLLQTSPDILFFYDDNEYNIKAISKLQKKYTNVKIKTVKVSF